MYYQNNEASKYQRAPGSSMIKPAMAGANSLIEKKAAKSQSSEMNYDGEANTNISFQSHRNNSNSRIGMGVNNAYQSQLQQQQLA